jgi:hypothetical protein
MKPPPEVLAYYDRFVEETRLQSGPSRLKLERTKEILARVRGRRPASSTSTAPRANAPWLADASDDALGVSASSDIMRGSE